MSTQKEIFAKNMKQIGFHQCSENVFSLSMNPQLFRTENKDIVGLGNIFVSIMGGSGIEHDNFGCVVFEQKAIQRSYRCRKINETRYFTQTSIPKTAFEAVSFVKKSIKNTLVEKAKWKKIL